MIKNKTVLEPYRIDMNGFIETGSAGTGSWQVEILITLLIAIKVWENFASSVYGFLKKQPEIMSRKRKITRILLVFEQNGRAFRPFIYQKNTSNLEEKIISKFSKIHCKFHA